MSDTKKWWEFKMSSTNEADLYLYIEIASWGAGYAAHSAQSFKEELDDLGEINCLNIYVNSPGGDVFEGYAIYNMLKRKKYLKKVYVDGIAASVASIIAMAGDQIIMPSNSMLMIHNASGACWGTADEMRNRAISLDKISESARMVYVERSNGLLDEAIAKQLMDAETWLTAQECLQYGLCDEVVSAKQVVAKWDGNFFNAQNYKNVPTSMQALLRVPDELEEMPEDIKLLIQRINYKTV